MLNATTAAASATAAAADATPKLNADFSMFLRLLTTQMQNQDPLKPQDATQYTQQLVQFSQVEQSIAQTSALKDILSALARPGLADHSALIGREVELAGDMATLSADGAAWDWQTERPAASVTARIMDAEGTVLRTLPLNPAAPGALAWDGRDERRLAQPPGVYRIAFDAQDATGADVPVTSHGRVRIERVEQSENGLALRAGPVSAAIEGLRTIF